VRIEGDYRGSSLFKFLSIQIPIYIGELDLMGDLKSFGENMNKVNGKAPPLTQAIIPGLYETEHIPLADKWVHEHYFSPSMDWYVVETDGDLCFGCVCNGGMGICEWGYFQLSEMKAIKVPFLWGHIGIEKDLYWRIVKAGDIEKIVRMGGI
jgi:hypothetical protein